MRKDKPSIIIAYWDTEDSSNVGWAYRALWFDENGEISHEESGEFDGRENLSEKTIERRARAAAGYSRTQVPVDIKG